MFVKLADKLDDAIGALFGRAVTVTTTETVPIAARVVKPSDMKGVVRNEYSPPET